MTFFMNGYCYLSNNTTFNKNIDYAEDYYYNDL